MSEHPSQSQDPLALATDLVKTGRLEEAQQVLIQYLSKNPASEQAWLLMSYVVSNPLQQKDCLERVLKINPENHVAQSKLVRLSQPLAGSRPNATPPLPSPTAAPKPIPTPLESKLALATAAGKPVESPVTFEPAKPVHPQKPPSESRPAPQLKPDSKPITPNVESEQKQSKPEISQPPKPVKTGRPQSKEQPDSMVDTIGAVFTNTPSHSPFRRENLPRIGLIALGVLLIAILAITLLSSLVTPGPSAPTKSPTPETIIILVPSFPPTWTPTRTSTITPTSTATATPTGTPTSTPQFTHTKTPR